MNARPLPMQQPHAAHVAAESLDRSARMALGHASGGISPISITLAWTDWALNLATSPGTQARLAGEAQARMLQWLLYQTRSLARTEDAAPEHPLEQALADDSRFTDPAWKQYPWNALPAATKALEDWWDDACELHGMSAHSRRQMRFHTRQWLDMLAPSNWLASNPEALQKALHSAGSSLQDGMRNAIDDARLQRGMDTVFNPPQDLAPGAGLAMTPGQVVMRNHLIELIQYTPTTGDVFKEPVLIVPSCILKYYILDLSPHNSMVRWLVSQGHTVFMISWRNPDEEDALLEMNDYVREGVLEAMVWVSGETGAAIHLAGYCLGGTFAAIAAAALKIPRPSAAAAAPELASLTLLAAETDFREPGELGILIDEAQVDMLEAMMAEKGFLTGRQMAGSFQYLHSRDLVWSNRTRTLLLGEAPFRNDLMVWNADLTRLPAVMHSQYLRRMYLNNDLAEGRYEFDDHPVSLSDIHAPMFVVGTVKDHVSPWRSVFKIHRLVGAQVCFALTNGGHNAGIISEPGHRGRHFHLHVMDADEPRITADDWQALATRHDGSWWTAWHDWLAARSSAKPVPARAPRKAVSLGASPGHYVLTSYGD